jgi:16S rRNA (guanine966-N2)-methyltransferase
VREALFNMLAARLDFDGLTVLDLYAGSGALGLEAMSRGAAHATFVEVHPRSAAVIERNAHTLGFSNTTVLARPVAAVLGGGGRPVDLVLADPPYDLQVGEVNGVLTALSGGAWAAAGTVVAVERRTSSPSVTWPDAWLTWSERRYGDTRLEVAEVV